MELRASLCAKTIQSKRASRWGSVGSLDQAQNTESEYGGLCPSGSLHCQLELDVHSDEEMRKGMYWLYGETCT